MLTECKRLRCRQYGRACDEWPGYSVLETCEAVPGKHCDWCGEPLPETCECAECQARRLSQEAACTSHGGWIEC